MIFTSYKFLIFFAVALTGYYVIPKKIQWVWLLLTSYFFYIQSSPVFMIFLGASTVITYAAALLMGRINDRKEKYLGKQRSKKYAEEYKKSSDRKKLAICIIAAVLNVGILAYTKYINFFGENIFKLFGGEFTAIDVIIPLGISFYTFQSTGYFIDVYRGLYKPEKNLFKFALFVSFFPQILQGPIAKYNELAPQLFDSHRFEYDKVKSGMLRMLWGFFKKLVIADRAALLVNTVYNDWKSYNGFIVAVAAVLYMVQLYADFSGYMDIAIGAGETLGINMSENFNTPFFSKSVPEFWRRWHISLGRWFKDYIYIPMGGNRKGLILTLVNLSVVWLVTGIWHGASWNFVVWGVYFGALIVMSKLLSPTLAKINQKLKVNTECFSYNLFRILRTSALVCFGFIFFRADGCRTALSMIRKMFLECNPWVFTDGTLLKLGIDAKNMNVLIAAVAVLLCVSIANAKGIKVREKIMEQNLVFEWIVYLIGIFAVLIFGIYGPAYDATSFIYFGF